MYRNDFLKLAGAAVLSGVLPAGAAAQNERVVNDRPNILIILSDDQPYYTQAFMTKTNAALTQGLTFTEAYAPTPLCGPARAVLNTGVHSTRTGVRVNKNAAVRFNRARDGKWKQNHLGAILRRDAEYICGYFGKWTNGYEEIPAWQAPGYRARALSTWAVTLGNRDPVRANVDGTVRKTNIARRNETAWFGQKAKNFITNATKIQAETGEPWFCLASANAPHSPYDPSNTHRGSLNGISLPNRPNFDHRDPKKPHEVSRLNALTNATRNEMRDIYQGKREEMLDFDDAVANILSVVDFDTTYVFYLSDNGFFLGEHRLFSKGQPYEESTKTPLVVRGPAVVETTTSARLAAHVDLAPTVLELAGLDPGPDGYDMDGRSLLPLMVGAEEPEWRDALYMEMAASEAENRAWSAIRTAEALYVERETGEREYYDMAADPYQLSNLVSETDELTLHEMSTRLGEMNGTKGERLRAVEASPNT